MKKHEVMATKPKVLDGRQREAFFERGYLVINEFLDQKWLDRIWEVTNSAIEQSKEVYESDSKFDLEPDHSAQDPRLRRLTYPTAHHNLYWEFASRGPIVDVAEDLLGPNVVFHHSKLNFKWSGGGEEVKWHQDYPFYPQTGYSILAIGMYLSDVDDEMGPMGAIPGSHVGPIYDHYSEDGNWTGALREKDLKGLSMDSVEWMSGKAGTITVHNARTVHGSMPNFSQRPRPLLINAYSSADVLPLTAFPGSESAHNCTLIRGTAPTQVELEAKACTLPPDWSGGNYTSIFEKQQTAN